MRDIDFNYMAGIVRVASSQRNDYFPKHLPSRDRGARVYTPHAIKSS